MPNGPTKDHVLVVEDITNFFKALTGGKDGILGQLKPPGFEESINLAESVEILEVSNPKELRNAGTRKDPAKLLLIPLLATNGKPQVCHAYGGDVCVYEYKGGEFNPENGLKRNFYTQLEKADKKLAPWQGILHLLQQIKELRTVYAGTVLDEYFAEDFLLTQANLKPFAKWVMAISLVGYGKTWAFATQAVGGNVVEPESVVAAREAAKHKKGFTGWGSERYSDPPVLGASNFTSAPVDPPVRSTPPQPSRSPSPPSTAVTSPVPVQAERRPPEPGFVEVVHNSGAKKRNRGSSRHRGGRGDRGGGATGTRGQSIPSLTLTQHSRVGIGGAGSDPVGDGSGNTGSPLTGAPRRRRMKSLAPGQTLPDLEWRQGSPKKTDARSVTMVADKRPEWLRDMTAGGEDDTIPAPSRRDSMPVLRNNEREKLSDKPFALHFHKDITQGQDVSPLILSSRDIKVEGKVAATIKELHLPLFIPHLLEQIKRLLGWEEQDFIHPIQQKIDDYESLSNSDANNYHHIYISHVDVNMLGKDEQCEVTIYLYRNAEEDGQRRLALPLGTFRRSELGFDRYFSDDVAPEQNLEVRYALSSVNHYGRHRTLYHFCYYQTILDGLVFRLHNNDREKGLVKYGNESDPIWQAVINTWVAIYREWEKTSGLRRDYKPRLKGYLDSIEAGLKYTPHYPLLRLVLYFHRNDPQKTEFNATLIQKIMFDIIGKRKSLTEFMKLLRDNSLELVLAAQLINVDFIEFISKSDSGLSGNYLQLLKLDNEDDLELLFGISKNFARIAMLVQATFKRFLGDGDEKERVIVGFFSLLLKQSKSHLESISRQESESPDLKWLSEELWQYFHFSQFLRAVGVLLNENYGQGSEAPENKLYELLGVCYASTVPMNLVGTGREVRFIPKKEYLLQFILKIIPYIFHFGVESFMKSDWVFQGFKKLIGDIAEKNLENDKKYIVENKWIAIGKKGSEKPMRQHELEDASLEPTKRRLESMVDEKIVSRIVTYIVEIGRGENGLVRLKQFLDYNYIQSILETMTRIKEQYHGNARNFFDQLVKSIAISYERYVNKLLLDADSEKVLAVLFGDDHITINDIQYPNAMSEALAEELVGFLLGHLEQSEPQDVTEIFDRLNAVDCSGLQIEEEGESRTPVFTQQSPLIHRILFGRFATAPVEGEASTVDAEPKEVVVIDDLAAIVQNHILTLMRDHSTEAQALLNTYVQRGYVLQLHDQRLGDHDAIKRLIEAYMRELSGEAQNNDAKFLAIRNADWCQPFRPPILETMAMNYHNEAVEAYVVWLTEQMTSGESEPSLENLKNDKELQALIPFMRADQLDALQEAKINISRRNSPLAQHYLTVVVSHVSCHFQREREPSVMVKKPSDHETALVNTGFQAYLEGLATLKAYFGGFGEEDLETSYSEVDSYLQGLLELAKTQPVYREQINTLLMREIVPAISDAFNELIDEKDKAKKAEKIDALKRHFGPLITLLGYPEITEANAQDYHWNKELATVYLLLGHEQDIAAMHEHYLREVGARFGQDDTLGDFQQSVKNLKHVKTTNEAYIPLTLTSLVQLYREAREALRDVKVVTPCDIATLSKRIQPYYGRTVTASGASAIDDVGEEQPALVRERIDELFAKGKMRPFIAPIVFYYGNGDQIKLYLDWFTYYNLSKVLQSFSGDQDDKRQLIHDNKQDICALSNIASDLSCLTEHQKLKLLSHVSIELHGLIGSILEPERILGISPDDAIRKNGPFYFNIIRILYLNVWLPLHGSLEENKRETLNKQHERLTTLYQSWYEQLAQRVFAELPRLLGIHTGNGSTEQTQDGGKEGGWLSRTSRRVSMSLRSMPDLSKMPKPVEEKVPLHQIFLAHHYMTEAHVERKQQNLFGAICVWALRQKMISGSVGSQSNYLSGILHELRPGVNFDSLKQEQVIKTLAIMPLTHLFLSDILHIVMPHWARWSNTLEGLGMDKVQQEQALHALFNNRENKRESFVLQPFRDELGNNWDQARNILMLLYRIRLCIRDAHVACVPGDEDGKKRALENRLEQLVGALEVVSESELVEKLKGQQAKFKKCYDTGGECDLRESTDSIGEREPLHSATSIDEVDIAVSIDSIRKAFYWECTLIESIHASETMNEEVAEKYMALADKLGLLSEGGVRINLEMALGRRFLELAGPETGMLQAEQIEPREDNCRFLVDLMNESPIIFSGIRQDRDSPLKPYLLAMLLHLLQEDYLKAQLKIDNLCQFIARARVVFETARASEMDLSRLPHIQGDVTPASALDMDASRYSLPQEHSHVTPAKAGVQANGLEDASIDESIKLFTLEIEEKKKMFSSETYQSAKSRTKDEKEQLKLFLVRLFIFGMKRQQLYVLLQITQACDAANTNDAERYKQYFVELLEYVSPVLTDAYSSHVAAGVRSHFIFMTMNCINLSDAVGKYKVDNEVLINAVKNAFLFFMDQMNTDDGMKNFNDVKSILLQFLQRVGAEASELDAIDKPLARSMSQAYYRKLIELIDGTQLSNELKDHCRYSLLEWVMQPGNVALCSGGDAVSTADATQGEIWIKVEGILAYFQTKNDARYNHVITNLHRQLEDGSELKQRLNGFEYFSSRICANGGGGRALGSATGSGVFGAARNGVSNKGHVSSAAASMPDLRRIIDVAAAAGSAGTFAASQRGRTETPPMIIPGSPGRQDDAGSSSPPTKTGSQ